MSARGLFVTLEGGEGVGKTTLAAGLRAALVADGYTVTVTREPGGSTGADAIRALLVTGEADRWSVVSEALLLAAARNDHLERTIRPALAAGHVVICDRYLDSTYAYQVAGRDLPITTFETLRDLIGAPTPDLTLILDLESRRGVARSTRGGGAQEDRYESMDHAFHERVRAAFLDVAARAPERYVVIDSTQDKAHVLSAALRAVRACAAQA
jgi:dTMP kinase